MTALQEFRDRPGGSFSGAHARVWAWPAAHAGSRGGYGRLIAGMTSVWAKSSPLNRSGSPVTCASA